MKTRFFNNPLDYQRHQTQALYGGHSPENLARDAALLRRVRRYAAAGQR
mgnify:FL=1